MGKLRGATQSVHKEHKSMIQPIQLPKMDAYKYGQSDALFGRPCKSPWFDHVRQEKYVLGYLSMRVIAKRINLTEQFKEAMA